MWPCGYLNKDSSFCANEQNGRVYFKSRSMRYCIIFCHLVNGNKIILSIGEPHFFT